MKFNSGLLDPVSHAPLLLEPGVYKISRRKLLGPGTHYGVLILTRETAYTPVVLHKQLMGLRVVNATEFAHGHVVTLQQPVTGREASDAVQRARKILHENRPFNVFSSNCEHAANEVVAGRHESGQINLLGLGAVLLVIFAFGKAG